VIRTRFAALGAALAVALPAAAAQKMPAPAPSRAPAPRPPAAAPAPAPATTPAARPSPAAASPAAAEAVAPLAADRGLPSGWRVGPGLGIELGMGDQDYTAVKVRIDAERPLQRLSPRTTLSFVGSFSASHPSGEETVPLVVDPLFGVLASTEVQWDANVFELVPALRLIHAATPKVSFFADGGVGAVYTAARGQVTTSVLPGQDLAVVEDGLGGVVRLAGGLVLAPSPNVRVSLEAIGLHVRFGDGPGTAFNLFASISHRL
jgi:hypothetical protein